MQLKDYGEGIFCLDASYVRPEIAAIHLIVEQGRVALVDTGVNASLPAVQEALRMLGLDDSSVDYVVLSHVHLDHAGGAGAMMGAFAQAQLVVHPRGARHMENPAKLMAAVEAVYGEQQARALYGALLPIAGDRIVQAQDQASFTLGAGRRLRCVHTPGHAQHHLCLWDEQSRGMFTGDALGLSYRAFDVAGRAFVLPTTSPTQFDAQAMKESIGRIVQHQPAAAYMTHFGRFADVQGAAQSLLRMIDDFTAMALEVAAHTPQEQQHAALCARLRDYLLRALRAHGCALSEDCIAQWLHTDIDLNAQGLLYALHEQRRAQ